MTAGTSRHPSLDELSAWADGEIGGTLEQQVLAEHVAACPTCAALVEDFRLLAGAQVSAPVPPVPASLQGRVLGRLQGERRPGSRGPRRFVLPLGAAATLLIGVVAVWLYRQQPPPPPPLPAARVDTAGETVPPPASAPVPSAPAPSAPAPAPLRKSEAPAMARSEESKDLRANEPAPVALQVPAAHWVRLPLDVDKARTAAAPTPSADVGALEREREAGTEPCAVRDVLASPLAWPGMRPEDAQALAEEARAAGATEATWTTTPVPRLTLVVPAALWPQIQDMLTARGVAVPEALRSGPAGASCLLVPLEGAP